MFNPFSHLMVFKCLHILSNLPKKAASAVRIAELYAERWTIEVCQPEYASSLRLYQLAA